MTFPYNWNNKMAFANQFLMSIGDQVPIFENGLCLVYSCNKQVAYYISSLFSLGCHILCPHSLLKGLEGTGKYWKLVLNLAYNRE